MKFGPVPIAEARGAVLAHSVALPGGRLRKGKIVTAEDVAALQAAGLTEVTVARLEPGDVGEDAAATRLAAALLGDEPALTGLDATQATTGRVNLTSRVKGIVELSPDAINAINAVDPMITIATVVTMVVNRLLNRYFVKGTQVLEHIAIRSMKLSQVGLTTYIRGGKMNSSSKGLKALTMAYTSGSANTAPESVSTIATRKLPARERV